MTHPDNPTTQETLEIAAREFVQDLREGYGDQRSSIEIGSDGVVVTPQHIGRIAATETVTGKVDDGYGDQPRLIETQWGLTRTNQVPAYLLRRIQKQSQQPGDNS